MKHWIIILFGSIFFTKAVYSQTPLWKTVPSPEPMPFTKDSGKVNLNGISMYYAIFGSGKSEPVLLLHGGFTSSDYWSDEVKRLSATHEVIVTDSRGHGRTNLGNQPLSYALMADDVLKLMDALHLQKCAIVGWSDGGIIGLLLSIHHPERISRLFTFGANFNLSGYSNNPPDTAAGKKFMALARENYKRLSPAPDSFSTLQKALGALYDKEPIIAPVELKSIHCSTTIAAGEYDQFISRDHTEELARLIPKAKLVIIPRLGHGGVLQDPVAFHKAIISWLSD